VVDQASLLLLLRLRLQRKLLLQRHLRPLTAEPAAAAPVATPAPAPAAASAEHKPTGNADRTLMKRSTYCGVVDTGPVPGETFEQKVARLAALSAAAKQRAEGG
jgi:hypothetical protein